MKPIITTVLPHCSWLQFSVVKKNRQASRVHYCRRRILFLGRSWMVGVGQGVYLIWWQEKGQKKDSQSGKARGEQKKNKSFCNSFFLLSSAQWEKRWDDETERQGWDERTQEEREREKHERRSKEDERPGACAPREDLLLAGWLLEWNCAVEMDCRWIKKKSCLAAIICLQVLMWIKWEKNESSTSILLACCSSNWIGKSVVMILLMLSLSLDGARFPG